MLRRRINPTEAFAVAGPGTTCPVIVKAGSLFYFADRLDLQSLMAKAHKGNLGSIRLIGSS